MTAWPLNAPWAPDTPQSTAGLTNPREGLPGPRRLGIEAKGLTPRGDGLISAAKAHERVPPAVVGQGQLRA